MKRAAVSIAVAALLALVSLSLLLPPDGEERSEWLQFIGHFHPLFVHFPIALILLVPLLELAARRPLWSDIRPAAGFVLTLAMIASFIAPAVGWSLARSGGFSGPLLTQHMYGGIGVAAVTFACWMTRGRGVSHAVLLAGAVILVSFTGYRGGQLAHGERHLTDHMPEPLRTWLGVEGPAADVAPPDRSTFFGARIAPILEEHCVLCHGARRQRGKLRLDTYESIMRGGKDGAVIQAENASGSDLVRRISLPSSHKDFMPAEGKPPLSASDIKLIALWIDAGASPVQLVDSMAGAPKPERAPEIFAPDYTPQAKSIGELEAALGIRLVPRSQVKTDGLILRCVNAPDRCDDAALGKLAPVAGLIVDAELARTKVTDAGLMQLAKFVNLRYLDLSYTVVSGKELKQLVALTKLERLNLTGVAVSDADMEPIRRIEALEHVYSLR